MVHRAHTKVLSGVEGDADDELVGRNAERAVDGDRSGRALVQPLPGSRQVRAAECKGRVEVRSAVPGAVEVVAHDVDPVERGSDLGQFPGWAAQIARGQGCR